MWNCKENVGVGDSDPRWGNDKCRGTSWRSRNWSVTNGVLPIATVSGGSRPSPTRENKKPPRKGTENIMIPTHCARTGCRGIPTKNTRYRTMKRYRAGMGNKGFWRTVHALPVAARHKELTLDQCFLHKLSWSRVSSLNSWYLTSLVNLSFYNLETTFFFVKDKLLLWNL